MPCPFVPKENCWPPNVLPAPQLTHPGLSQAAVVPLLASSHVFHDCDPFCLCGVGICPQGGGTKAGCFKPSLSFRWNACCATNHRAEQPHCRCGQQPPCSTQHRARRAGLQKRSCCLTPCESASAGDTIYLIFQESKLKTEFKAVCCLQRGELCRSQEVLRVAEADTVIQTTESAGKFKGAWAFQGEIVLFT